MMDGRDAFLTLAREKHYELHNQGSLLSSPGNSNSSNQPSPGAQSNSSPKPGVGVNQGQDILVYACSNCEKHVETRYHCTICDDFDLCVSCFDKDGHNHTMEKLGFGLDDDSGTNSQVSRLLSIQRCIRYLVHAIQCRDADCRLPSCLKMKGVVQHAKSCKQKTKGGCPICKQLIALCCYHAKHCQKAKCPVPFCMNIKNKLRQRQLQQLLQQAEIIKRRLVTMQNCRMSSAVLLSSPENSNSSNQPSPGAQSNSSPQPGVGVNQRQDILVYTCSNCEKHVET